MPESPLEAAAAAEEARLRSQAAETPRLGAAEEAELLARRDDVNARELLVRHNLDLVVEQADGHAGRGVLFSDLYQEGAIGLVDAVVVYQGGGAFRDFARLHVGLQMDALIESEDDAKREDRQMVADSRALDLAQVELGRRLGREPTDPELAAALEWDAERLRRVHLSLDLARERNDELTAAFLDEDDEIAALEWFEADEPDPRRKLPGAGPDE